jgi:hypothetical protein
MERVRADRSRQVESDNVFVSTNEQTVTSKTSNQRSTIVERDTIYVDNGETKRKRRRTTRQVEPFWPTVDMKHDDGFVRRWRQMLVHRSRRRVSRR